jgi:hypothetical protein
MKRIFLAPFLFFAITAFTACASHPTVERATSDFSGAWSVKLCDQSDPKRQCGAFDLYLVQDESGRICGEHFVATPGLARLDESDPATVLGTAGPKTGVVIIKSTRNDARYMARLSMVGNRLHWELIGMVSSGLNDEPPIILVKKHSSALNQRRSCNTRKTSRIRANGPIGCRERWPFNDKG